MTIVVLPRYSGGYITQRYFVTSLLRYFVTSLLFVMSINQLIPLVVVLFILLGAGITFGFLWCTQRVVTRPNPPTPPSIDPIDAVA